VHRYSQISAGVRQSAAGLSSDRTNGAARQIQTTIETEGFFMSPLPNFNSDSICHFDLVTAMICHFDDLSLR
jgi:hypothetical protein